jgi:hypothetical protein
VVGTPARAFVLLNRWHSPSDEAYLKVRAQGARGLSGCVAAILDEQGDVRSTQRFPARGSGRATGPAEFCFGVTGLDRCTARIAFSQGEWIIAPWQRGKGVQALTISPGAGEVGSR